MKVQKINIAIIDDSTVTLHLVKKIVLGLISEEHLNIQTFVNGEEFILSCKNEKLSYDLIITDYNMPKKNGIDVIKYCKMNDLKQKKAKIFVISANKERKIITDCLRAGAENYLNKPFSPEIVSAKVKSALIEIIKTKKKIEAIENGIKTQTEDEIKMELYMSKINDFVSKFINNNKELSEEEYKGIKKFIGTMPTYIEEDEEFKIEFFQDKRK